MPFEIQDLLPPHLSAQDAKSHKYHAQIAPGVINNRNRHHDFGCERACERRNILDKIELNMVINEERDDEGGQDDDVAE